jgi:hypothetical protein
MKWKGWEMALDQDMHVHLWKHQAQLIAAPYVRPDIEFFFLIGGYGCGKTSGDVFLLFSLMERYEGQNVTIGVGGTTITLLRKTLIAEFERYMIMTGIKFTDDKNANMIQVGSVTFILVALEQPNLLYAYNFNIFIADEIDELPSDKCLDAFKAIQERTRITLPDGRIPYTVFTTTAQGYSGTYALIEQLKDIGQPYVKIRGLTKDNLSLSRSYVNRLYSIYDENERLAFLEGHFVNLRTGKVYSDYDASVNMMNPFKPEPIHIVQVGQDLNAGFSKGVALIKREKRLEIIKEFSFTQIGNAPKIMRTAFPMNDILWYPDATAKEIMNGYTAEMGENNIKMRVGSINPSIVERIFIVNKLFKMNRLFVSKDCKKLDISLKTRQYAENGDPEKGRGENAPDHICDALEYVSWRIVSADPDFRDLWELTPGGRRTIIKAA